MGAKTSKPELTRKKSFSNIGRSSQRSLFQKCKIKLNSISRQINQTEVQPDVENLERLKVGLEDVEKELSGISDSVKLKNQEKYDDVYKYFQSTRKKYDDKFQKTSQPEEIKELNNEDGNDIILRNAPVEPNVEIVDYAKEPQSLGVRFDESKGDSNCSDEPKRPSIKFGVQVLPPSPQISHVVLKRKTYPNNSSPRSEFFNIRNTTEGVVTHVQNGTTTKAMMSETKTYNSNFAENKEYTSAFSESSFKKDYLKSNSILGIEGINHDVNELEDKLKYFTGTKESESYIELHQGLTKNLTLLVAMDAEDEPITKQEKKILSQRINELLRILDCLVEQINQESISRFSQRSNANDVLVSPGTAI